jgi:hypothetical protein
MTDSLFFGGGGGTIAKFKSKLGFIDLGVFFQRG